MPLYPPNTEVVFPSILSYYYDSGAYDAWDRFGRTLQHKWKTSGETVRDQVDYTYDYAGNRLTRDVASTTTYDQTYTYDGLHRLQTVDETTAANDRYWELDQLGNWSKLRNGLTGASTILEERTHNDVNELTAFTTPTTTVDPVHDAAGNLTTIPQPQDPSQKFDLVYDAWNRLVTVKNHNGTTVTTSEYDGLNRRIIRDESGGGGELKHFYYNDQ